MISKDIINILFTGNRNLEAEEVTYPNFPKEEIMIRLGMVKQELKRILSGELTCESANTSLGYYMIYHALCSMDDLNTNDKENNYYLICEYISHTIMEREKKGEPYITSSCHMTNNAITIEEMLLLLSVILLFEKNENILQCSSQSSDNNVERREME